MNTIAEKLPSTVSPKAPRLHWPLIWTIVTAASVVWGMHAHLERYITPQRGLGYWLGITGGSMMLLLLLYSARKRANWLRWLCGVPARVAFPLGAGLGAPGC